ncbi:hypothetical protein NDU88_004233 [Pleurodeles waltl]|uniref:SAP domain-containing protein n=1 Tax=Pleurodeles waltl TaxID=8319 RepID=A0AAV7M7N9_PLEWA|nr:hypothetical protein NDU88_004233 [Pleurodeles waltl]
MSHAGDSSVGADFDLEKLESYTKAQLKQFCKSFDCPIKSSSRKEELQKALRAWVTAKSTEGHTEDEGDEEDEEACSVHNGIVGGPVMSREKVSRPGSSVSSKGLTPEELQDRQAEREYQLEQRRLALEEGKSAMAHELSLKEMDHRSQSSRDGGSNPTVQPERRVHIPKDLVNDYKREDGIYLWFKGYESALHMNLVPEAHWGASLWKHFEVEGRDTLTALGDVQNLTYSNMKDALLTRYGLTPEQYKDKFRSYKKKESQTWLECVDSYCRSLDGWVKGSKVTTYERLYNLIAWEHLYSLYFPELRQHLINSKLTDLRKLAQEAYRWESTRVQRGNDLEDSPWKEVEHRSHLEMLGLPGWVCVSTRSMAARHGNQEPLEPETVAQGTAKKRKGRGRRKPAPKVPTVQEEAEPEGDTPEPTVEQVAELGEVPELLQWQQEGGPTREAFCAAQKSCPTLEGLWQQAADQAAGKETGSHLIYWEDDLLYSEPKVPEPGSARMVMGLSEPLRRKWDVLLPCLLFAYRDVPQKGLGFSLFELIYGHPVRGPLSLVKEALEKAPSKHPQDVFSYMLAMRNQTARFRSLAQENLEASQEDMKRWYDQNATLVEFQPGQKVWVMAPVEPRALQDKWTGPFEVVERKSEVTYLVDLRSPRNP